MTRPSQTAPRYDVLGVQIDPVDPDEARRRIAAWVGGRARMYVCFANVHGIMEALQDPRVRAAYRFAGLTVPDGMPIVWLGRLSGRQEVCRVYGPDLTLELCDAAARSGWSCFFYGGAPGVAASLAASLARRFPGLRVAGVMSPPYRELSAHEDAEAVALINRAGADLVFVGLGCPRQELWMASHRDRLEAPVLLGVGAAFDFHTGRVAQAPRWMMRAGLEWLFRLGQEPRRLARRYLLLNPLFVLHVALQKAGLRRYPPAGTASQAASGPPGA